MRQLDALAELGVADFNAVLVPVEGDPEARVRTGNLLQTRERDKAE